MNLGLLFGWTGNSCRHATCEGLAPPRLHTAPAHLAIYTTHYTLHKTLLVALVIFLYPISHFMSCNVRFFVTYGS